MEVEFFDHLMAQAERTAIGFCKGRNKAGDKEFVEESIAHAWFVVWELLARAYEGIKAKLIVENNTLEVDKSEFYKFFRMSVGYALKNHWAHRNTSTLSKLKARGITYTKHRLDDVSVVEYTNDIDYNIALDNAVRSGLERKVVEFFIMGNDYETIAIKCSCSVKGVRKILAKIKKRLKRAC